MIVIIMIRRMKAGGQHESYFSFSFFLKTNCVISWTLLLRSQIFWLVALTTTIIIPIYAKINNKR